MAPHVLLIPFPAQGHMLPLLDLALSFPATTLLTVATTPSNLPLLAPLLSFRPSTRTLALPFPSHPALPPDAENLKDLPAHHFFHVIHALGDLHSPVVQWAGEVDPKVDVVVSDFFLGWTTKMAEEIGAKRVVFCPSGAMVLALGQEVWRRLPEERVVRFEGVPGSPVFLRERVSSIYARYKKGEAASEFIRQGYLTNMESWGYIFNTFEALEGAYLNHLRKSLPHAHIWAVGPINGGVSVDRGGRSSIPVDSIISWLDKHEHGSVVYICFGSQAELTPQQMDALAHGLKMSNVKFVWCVRSPGCVPNWFGKDITGRGMVIEGWAPQVAILEHPAVGSFLTHCGWNSILEGVAAGVVLLTWPMRADQFVNARLLEEMGVGVGAWEGSVEVPDPAHLAAVFAAATSSGEEERRKVAAEMKGTALAAVERGGSSYKDLFGFFHEIEKLQRINELVDWKVTCEPTHVNSKRSVNGLSRDKI